MPDPPSTLPIPPTAHIDLQRTIAAAETDIAKECAHRNPYTRRQGCGPVQGAEMHMRVRDPGDATGIPVWTITFGQYPRWADDVSRVVDARTGQIVARNVGSSFPTGVIPSVRATVVGLRFFLGTADTADPEPPARRSYDDYFFYNAARYVHWELDLVHPAPGRRTSFTVQTVWNLPGATTFREAPRVLTLEGDWTSSRLTGSANLQGTRTVVIRNPSYESCESERGRERARAEREGRPAPISGPCPRTQSVEIRLWSAGGYRVDLFVDGEKVASGSFEMKGKEQIYGAVEARTRDRAAPTGEIGYLDAKVTALRFFEMGAEGPPPEPRRYATRFPLAGTRIAWQLDLKHAAPGRWIELPLEAFLYYTGADVPRVVQRKVLQAAVPADWADTQHWDAFGWDNDYYYVRSGATTPSPRGWQPGVYRVDLFAGGRGSDAYRIASGSFEIL